MGISNESFVAFFSYVRRNDELDRGKLTDLRKLLESELWAQTAKDLRIFQDMEDIEWGNKWKERIISALDKSTYLIAIVTPSYLESQWCRFEFEYFLKEESQHKLILPIIYIDTPKLKNSYDEIAREISKRQCIDWKDLRSVTVRSKKTTEKIGLLAKHIRDLISNDRSTLDVTVQESVYPPNSLLKNTVKDEHQKESIQIQPSDSLPSLNIPLAQEKKNKEHPSQQITVVLRSTGHKERDRRRIKAIYGTLISFHGHDHFSLQIFEAGKGHLIDFPYDTTRICFDLLERLKKLMGDESWRVEEITFQ